MPPTKAKTKTVTKTTPKKPAGGKAAREPASKPARKPTSGGAAAADPGMSDAAVQKATGRTWAQWCAVLDKAGAQQMPHKQIAELVQEKHDIPGWWAQTVTVGYERLRGLRKTHETTSGFQISVSKTIEVPIARAFEAWSDEAIRARWLPRAKLTIRRQTPHKSMRITWEADGSSLEAMFYPKGDAKCQVVAQASKLPDVQTAEQRKSYWSERLAALKQLLESREP